MGKPCNAATYRKAAFDLACGYHPEVIVEVGVYAGDLSRMFAQVPGVKATHIVDSWKGDYCKFGQPHMDKIAAGVKAWAETDPKVTVWHMDTAEGVKHFDDESIDFWHTDGDHSLAGITRDISLWLPKVKKGGILSGDNYEIPEVAAGVKALLPKHKLLANGRLWFAQKL